MRLSELPWLFNILKVGFRRGKSDVWKKGWGANNLKWCSKAAGSIGI